MSSNKKEMRNLQPIDYVMCEHDVYCGRGNLCFHYIGNQRFRKIILENLIRYSDTTHKYEKSSIINEIVHQVREISRPYNGLGFVRKDSTTGRFYEVSKSIAREKTSQAFRDAFREKSNPKKTNQSIEQKHRVSDIVYQSDEENYNCDSELSSENSTSNHIDNLRKNLSPTLRSYDSICDTFEVPSELPQQTYKNYLISTKFFVEESSSVEPFPVTNGLQNDSNIDFISRNEKIQTRSTATNYYDLSYSYGNDTVKAKSIRVIDVNESYNDCYPQSNVITSSSSQTKEQAQFFMNRIEEICSAVVSDDEKTFDILFQLTESYPDLLKCPFLQGTIQFDTLFDEGSRFPFLIETVTAI